MRLTVPEPCHENWNDMNPDAHGRHCAVCEKTVTDFTCMSDAQIIAVLSNNPKTCGRYYVHQLDRELVPSRHSWYKYLNRAAATGLLLSFWPLKHSANNIRMGGTTQGIYPLQFYLPVEQQPFISDSTVRIVIQQLSDSAASVQKLKFSLDDFTFTADSVQSSQLHFHIPRGRQGDTCQFILYTADTSYTFQIPVRSVLGSSGAEIHFSYTGRNWTFSFPLGIHIPHPQIVMGIPSHPWQWEFQQLEISNWTLATPDSVVATPDTLSKDSTIQPADTLKHQMAEVLQPVSARRNYWWWFLALPALPLLWWVARRRKKQNREA